MWQFGLGSHRARKASKRGGIRQHGWRATKLPLPPILLCNLHSLKSNLDKLHSLVGACYEYPESGLMACTETWLCNDVLVNFIYINGFPNIRSDRDENSGKTRSRELCVFVKDSWCRNFAVRNRLCNPDLDLLCVTLQPHYQPREFTNIHYKDKSIRLHFNHYIQVFHSVPLPQVYKIKHLAMMSAFTNICERISCVEELTFESIRVPLLQQISSQNLFPPRYFTVNCKWYYCKVEAFRNQSNSTKKWKTT